MLFLTRKTGQAVIINDAIEVNVVEISGKTVKLGFKFPPTESVLRRELHEKIKNEMKAAAKSTEAAGDQLTQTIVGQIENLQSHISSAIVSQIKNEQTNMVIVEAEIDASFQSIELEQIKMPYVESTTTDKD